MQSTQIKIAFEICSAEKKNSSRFVSCLFADAVCFVPLFFLVAASIRIVLVNSSESFTWLRARNINFAGMKVTLEGIGGDLGIWASRRFVYF